MSDIIVDWFKIAVNVILNALTILLIIGTFALVSVFTTAIKTQEATNQKLAETAEYSQFTSGTAMRGSDVIAAIMKYKDTIGIIVYSSSDESVVQTATYGYYDSDMYIYNTNGDFVKSKSAGTACSSSVVLSSSDYTLTTLSSKIKSSSVYTPQVGYGASGEILTIWFTPTS